MSRSDIPPRSLGPRWSSIKLGTGNLQELVYTFFFQSQEKQPWNINQNVNHKPDFQISNSIHKPPTQFTHMYFKLPS